MKYLIYKLFKWPSQLMKFKSSKILKPKQERNPKINRKIKKNLKKYLLNLILACFWSRKELADVLQRE